MSDFIKLKVYKNKKNSQRIVMLPKKKMVDDPEYVFIKIRRKK